jgi:hypothetical protein
MFEAVAAGASLWVIVGGLVGIGGFVVTFTIGLIYAGITNRERTRRRDAE